MAAADKPAPGTGRQDRPQHLLTRLLRMLSAGALVLAAVALAAPPGVRETLSYLAVGLVLVGPVLRLSAPAREWVRPPDRLFLLIAVVVTVVLPLCTALITAGG